MISMKIQQNLVTNILIRFIVSHILHKSHHIETLSILLKYMYKIVQSHKY